MYRFEMGWSANLSRHVLSPRIRQAVALLLIAGLWGCAHGTRRAPPAPALTSPGDSPVQGPPPPEAIFGPAPPQARKVVVLLGPGLSAAMGAAGVIRALEEAKVEVAGLVGMEMGAVVSAAYAITGTANGMDWRLLQIRPEWFGKGVLDSLLSRDQVSAEKIRAGLSKVFGSSEISSSKRKLWVVVKKPNGIEVVDRGPLVSAVLGSLSSPEWLTATQEGESPSDWGGVEAALSAELPDMPRVWVLPKLSEKWPMASARAAIRNARQWIRGSDLVLEIEAGEPFDFSRRSERAYLAKKTCRAALPLWMGERGWSAAP